jgi:dihydrofolate reductase
MSKLIYIANTSLDGYVEDAAGSIDWAAPDEEVHKFINELVRPVGTYLYGRRMYETMLYWETADTSADVPVFVRDFTDIWLAAEKVVYSHTLKSPLSARTRVEPRFGPEDVRHLKASKGDDISIGGADLAGQAIAAGLVDELHVLTAPVVLGGGKSWLPVDVRLNLELLDTRRFASGVVFLNYRVASLGGRARR